MVEGASKRERARRGKRRKEEGRYRNNGAKLASLTREQAHHGGPAAKNHRRRGTNGGSLSSRGSATGMQCGLCAILAGLFRRAMCIAGSRRGSGESTYQELATDQQQQQQLQQQQQQQHHHHHQQPIIVPSDKNIKMCEVGLTITTATPERSPVSMTNRSFRDSIAAEPLNADVIVDSTQENALFRRISEEAELPSSGDTPQVVSTDNNLAGINMAQCVSETDRLLLDGLDVHEHRNKHTGRFLTMHKRRRKKLTTRSLNQDPGLLDDIFHGQVQCILQRAGHWRFNAFTLETVSGGRSLPVLCVHLFQWYGLIQQFNLDVVRVWKLFALIEEGYHSTNPYHNSIHATDVTQAMHCFLQEHKIKKHLTNLEVMASLIAAVTHDLDHPGVNQPFLVATSNHLATLYENTSVLENHHWRSAIACLLESGVAEQLSPEVRPELQRYISSLILATDITRQQEFLTRFKSYLDKKALDMRRAENRHFILQIALKCADISNPCRPWDISRKWSYKVCEEFFRQGDYERQLNLPVTPLCDRNAISIPKIQVGFFEFVVTPLYQEWHRFLGDGLSITLMHHLRDNQKRWQALIAQENAAETKTEMSDLEEALNSSSSEEENIQEDSGSVELTDYSLSHHPISSNLRRRSSLPTQNYTRRVGRRHSVPMHTNLVSVPPPRSALRRESVPCQYDESKNPLLKLDDQLSSLSLLSSKSSLLESGTNNSTEPRPVSAENLLPETSIASITSSAEASRLCTLLQPEPLKSSSSQSGKQLTRQQTFPPLQPYVRIRYMSTTAEMSKCRTEILMEAESSLSSSSTSPSKDKSSSSTNRQRKITTRAYTIDHSTRRRESAFAVAPGPPGSDLNRLNVDAIGEHRRRHSVQGVKSDESKYYYHQRYKRPSSAQESDPAQIYANLTGSTKVREKSMGNDSRPVSRSDSEQQWSLGECAIEEQTAPDAAAAGAAAAAAAGGGPNLVYTQSTKVRENELRRFSAPGHETTTSNCDSSSNGSSVRRFTTIPVTSELPTHKVFFIGSPPESPPRLKNTSSSSDSGGSEPRRSIGEETSCENETLSSYSVGSKRDYCDGSRYSKGGKIPKISDETRMKENVDPRVSDETKFCHTRRTSQGLIRRRGSAPVGLISRIDDVLSATSTSTKLDGNVRRGSVPADIADHQSEREQLPINNNNSNNNSNNNNSPKTVVSSPRRGSVPADISELRRDLFSRNSVNGKTRNRKKTLKRRSSGGPEMFSGDGGVGNMDDNENGKLSGWKREVSKRDSIPEPSVKRRGSLPVEMVSISHAGNGGGTRRSSLWRL